MFLIQCYLFIRKMVLASRNLKFKFPDTWLRKLLSKQKKLQRRSYIFLLESLFYKVRDDLAVNSSAIEYLCVEAFNKNSKSIVVNLAFRPPNGDPNELENHFKNIFFIFRNGKLPIRNQSWSETLILMSLIVMKAKWFKVL